MARITSSAGAPCSRSRYFFLPSPTPCSPVQVPPKASARFYADQLLPQAYSYAETVKAGNAALAGLGDELF